MAAALWLCSLLEATASVIQPRDYPYDQIRFMHCSNTNVDDDHSYIQIGYYKWAPQPGNQGQAPDDLLDYGERKSGGWNIGATGSYKAKSTGLYVELHIDSYQYSADAFQSWIGTTTYNGNGFNCFIDDKHAVHVDPGYGQCYTDIYCTHQDATKVEMLASKDAITLQQRGAFTPKDILKTVEGQLHGGQCDESLVNVPGDGIVKLQCNGDKNAVSQLASKLQRITPCSNARKKCKPHIPVVKEPLSINGSPKKPRLTSRHQNPTKPSGPNTKGKITLHSSQLYITPPVVRPKNLPVEDALKSTQPVQSNLDSFKSIPPGIGV